VRIKSLLKYAVRFLFLQALLTALTIYYFDNFLIYRDSEVKYQIYLNLLEDNSRFYPFIDLSLITVDAFLAVFIFIFLIILYSTNFYTYVNELSFSLSKNYFDEFFQIFLLWTSWLFSAFYIFRFESASRGHLILFSIIVPLILLIFRNTEYLSSVLGRSVINEKFITFNLDKNSNFRNLRILSFRKELASYSLKEENMSNLIIEKIDEINKSENINLVVISINKLSKLNKKLENYLININKKILIISPNKMKFGSNFLYREQIIDDFYFVYFNNDIQYGSKYILKRFLDIVLSVFALFLLTPFLLFIGIYIFIKDRGPIVIKQDRVGLHGKQFKMYKFRTMLNNAHELRDELQKMNKKSGPLFKIDNDPRLINGAEFLRKFSLDELPQLINVLKGEMSLVGPRPLFDTDTKTFTKTYMRRLNVMPGMTGLLQITDRNADDFETWFKYDVEYIENWSLYLDIKILLKTVPSLLNKKVQGK
tara:strand:- start:5193 stop:6632 length:1440 start_codon:yes stop_codon:yes gene_type:complete